MRQRTLGFSIFEAIITVAIIGTLTGLAAVGLKNLEDPVGNAASQLEGMFKQVRAKAIANTSAYRLRVQVDGATGETILYAERALTCSDVTGWTADGLVRRVRLKAGITMTPSTLNVCFTSRGAAVVPTSPATIALSNGSKVRHVDVFAGGGIRSR